MDIEQWAAIAGIAAAALGLAATAATETAIERANDVRIQALAARGDPRALRIAGDVGRPRQFLGPLTTARVLCGAAVVTLFAALGAHGGGAARAIGFGAIGGLVAALIEMTVGLTVARQPEYAALQLAAIARFVGLVFAAPAAVLGLPARVVARSLRWVAPDTDSDILALVEREEATGGVEEQEQRMIRGIIGLEDKTAREIMVPRIDMAAVDIDATVGDVATLVNDRGFSRVPVYRETIDDIVGIVYAKDLLRATMTGGGRERKLQDLLREAFFIPESKRLDGLLTEMQTSRTHLAIVVDEYGGTAGLVTIEDLLEEIVGEIEDEYDTARPPMEVVSSDEVVLDAGLPTDVLDELFDYRVESDDFDTVGGFLINQLGRLPSVGDEVHVNGLAIRVLSMSGRRVRRLRVTRATGN